MSEHQQIPNRGGPLEQFLGTVLRIGVLLAAVVVAAGAVFFLLQHGGEKPEFGVFHSEVIGLRSPGGIVEGALRLQSRYVIQFGLLLLIATPVARVIFSLFGFLLERDRVYMAITAIVLALLLYSLLGAAYM